MDFDKSACPGSRTIKEPTPEYHTCPKCGAEVEIWTHEISYPCSHCGTRVFRTQRPSCIDWCPHARECVGPNVFMSLKTNTNQGNEKTASPLDILSREHDEGTKKIALLRTATLCLKAGTKASGPPPAGTIERAIADLENVLAFTDNDLKTHFQREEEVLFPLVEKHIGKAGSPTQLLLEEHGKLWQERDQFRAKLEEFKMSLNGRRAESASDLYDLGSRFAGSLREHIAKENESLIPIAKKVLSSAELEEVERRWQK